MAEEIATLEGMYGCFDARDMDGLLAALTEDVVWANGMDGGHVHGRAAVRDYWAGQWAAVSPHVVPAAFTRNADGAMVVEVRQSVRDLDGQLLQSATHGLRDGTVSHVFRFRDGKVARFDIEEAAPALLVPFVDPMA